MLEGLPPNNAAHRPTLVTDARRARAVGDLIVESFEPAEAASAAFETDDAWPGGGKAWLVEAYFGFEPDESEVRALIAAATDEETARAAASVSPTSETGSPIRGTHRARRKKEFVKNPLDEIPGIGPARKRALLFAFGSAKAVARAGLADLEKTPGLNAATAKAVYDFFHETGAR